MPSLVKCLSIWMKRMTQTWQQRVELWPATPVVIAATVPSAGTGAAAVTIADTAVFTTQTGAAVRVASAYPTTTAVASLTAAAASAVSSAVATTKGATECYCYLGRLIWRFLKNYKKWRQTEAEPSKSSSRTITNINNTTDKCIGWMSN